MCETCINCGLPPDREDEDCVHVVEGPICGDCIRYWDTEDIGGNAARIIVGGILAAASAAARAENDD